MRLNGFRVFALVLGLLAAGCVDTAKTSAAPLPATASLAEASGLSPDDEIDGLDLAVATNGDVHLVWRERIGAYGDPGGERVVYRRGHGNPLRWSAPLVVTTGDSGEPRVAVTAQGVHVLAGPGLRHWLLRTGSDAFVDIGNVLSGRATAAALEVVAIGDRVVIVFVASEASDPQGIHAVTWSAAAGPTAPVLIAAATGATGSVDTAPALHPIDGRLMAVWSENTFTVTHDERTRATVHVPSARVRAAWSEDAGFGWGPPTEVTPTPPTSGVRAVAAAGAAGAPLAFFTALGLFGSRWSKGAWTEPVRIAAYEPGSLAGSAETSEVAAAQCGGHTVVAWVDARLRRSDRRWWNPLGGFPWSDNPDWHNNDLFVAMRMDLDAAAIQPIRLTSGASFTGDIAIAPRGNALLVLRAGRAAVRKSPGDAGAPPVILQSQLACD